MGLRIHFYSRHSLLLLASLTTHHSSLLLASLTTHHSSLLLALRRHELRDVEAVFPEERIEHIDATPALHAE